ncbi:DUF2793 domain-containing protein [Ancylobacter sp. WKF20]|uniref:DUF2793 domain-containing protein n=1 Tax=Ancylobacter sp. WKF20 TaxID=3039801 RepID=UPI00243427EA|nr:DUF2793 domain-containing protein [Ancylobacter sp. WKF20]WGD30402.1 DUF2793 domain-containing protein [Ancylobacter sp. WKF20]
MSEITPLLALPLIAAAQAQKHVTHNEALEKLDALTQLAVLDRTRASPPVAPVAGDRHLVAAGASGDWAGRDGAIALYGSDGWSFLTPAAGWRAYVAAERLTLVHTGTGWADLIAGTPSGGAVSLRAAEIEAVLSGASVTTALVIPARTICLAVASRTVTAITGASAYEVGITGETSKFGGSLGIAAGSSNIGVIGPQAFYADTPLRLTALGGAFTGGRVRLALFTLAFAL